MSYVDDAFAKMKSKLEITSTEEEAAATRQKLIRSHLDDHWDVDDDFLTGSYRRETKTRPLKDIDIFVVLDPNGDQSGLDGADPSRVLGDLARVLRLRWDDVSVDRMAAVVSYGADEASFEVVPAFAKDIDVFRIPDTLKGTWIETNPKRHHELSVEKNQECGGRYVPLVKMLKGANADLGDPISPSFLLEVMALDIIGVPFGRYQDEVSWFLSTAADRLAEDWPDPAELGPDVNAEMSASERRRVEAALRVAAEIAQRAVWLEDDGQERAAVEEWRKLFGWRMPRP